MKISKGELCLYLYIEGCCTLLKFPAKIQPAWKIRRKESIQWLSLDNLWPKDRIGTHGGDHPSCTFFTNLQQICIHCIFHSQGACSQIQKIQHARGFFISANCSGGWKKKTSQQRNKSCFYPNQTAADTEKTILIYDTTGRSFRRFYKTYLKF